MTAFTQGVSAPSARFRIQQYVPILETLGLRVKELPARYGSYPPMSAWRRPDWLARSVLERLHAAYTNRDADVVIFQREMISTLAFAEKLLPMPRVLDIDDAIWLNQRFNSVDRLADQCNLLVCGNNYIADHFPRHPSVHILPTAVDINRWSPLHEPRAEGPSGVIVWSGSSSGLPFLYSVESPLRATLRAVPGSRLRVVCDAPPLGLTSLSSDQVEWLPWSPEYEVRAVQTASVGIMPMPDGPWTQGKCSLKLLTYLSCGVPGVASPWGMNAEVIAGGGAVAAVRDDEWSQALIGLLREGDSRRKLGVQGRTQVEGKYSTQVLAPRLASLLRSTI